MNITNIKETGSSNTLHWAISNGGNPKSDEALASIINDETAFLVTISGLNFLEVFRLTQYYREKLRILSEHMADVPSNKELMEHFNGSFESPNNPGQKSPLYEVASAVCDKFMNLAKQMATDDDIISSRAQQLFIPMLCRKIDVQIPVGFLDFVNSISQDEANAIFTSEYPATLRNVVDADVHGFKTALLLNVVRSTQPNRYPKRYDQYLNMVKYRPLATKKDVKTLYKFGILGFRKYDNITRGEVSCYLSPTPPSADALAESLKRMASLTTPLKIDFAVQLPLQYMQVIENYFPRDILQITHESSITTILEGGISYNDFIEPNIPTDTEDPDELEALEKFNNEISAYRTRITEANQTLLNVLPVFLENDGDIDITGVFAMLPSVYTQKCVITLDISKAKGYMDCNDPVIQEMFKAMLGMADSIIADINRSK